MITSHMYQIACIYKWPRENLVSLRINTTDHYYKQENDALPNRVKS